VFLNTEVAQNIGLLFSYVGTCRPYINIFKNGLGYILSDFFTNSSGRPNGQCLPDLTGRS
jgi:hypothetical protein